MGIAPPGRRLVPPSPEIVYYSNADTSQGFGEMLSKSEIFKFMIGNNPVIEGLKSIK